MDNVHLRKGSGTSPRHIEKKKKKCGEKKKNQKKVIQAGK